MKKKYLRQGSPGKRSPPKNTKTVAHGEHATKRQATAKTSTQHRAPSPDETSAEVKRVSKGADEEMEWGYLSTGRWTLSRQGINKRCSFPTRRRTCWKTIAYLSLLLPDFSGASCASVRTSRYQWSIHLIAVLSSDSCLAPRFLLCCCRSLRFNG